uniref:Centrosomal protein 85 n=1 Tax=Crocodylus porosus TaxID=8502 RepID=A0A7M4E8F8_CROPO
MAALEKCPDRRFQRASPSDSSTGRKSCSLETDWKTPTLSAKFQSHFGRCSSTADSGDTAIGTSCSDSTEDFCTSSGSTSFQPIKTQVTIPTAHVMPSTLGMSPSKLCSTGEPDSLQKVPLSSKPALSASSTENAGLMRNGDPHAVKLSQGPPRELLQLYGTSRENSFEQSWLPHADHMRAEDNRKFDMPALEFTLNRSLWMDNLCSDPHHKFQKCNPSTIATDAAKEPYKVLPETQTAPGASGVCEPRNGTWPRGSRPTPLGLQPNNVFSKPGAPQAQVWRQEPCMLHPHERVCDLSAWKHQLDNIRVRTEQMQLQNGVACNHSSMYPTPLHAVDPAQWVGILNANENLLKEKEILIDRQRQHISQLEQKVRESELQVHSALLGCSNPYGDVCLLRLQELQRENTFLRAQFTEKTDSLNKEKIELERKLSASELDTRRIRETMKETVQKHAEEVKKQEERVKGRDRHINGLKKKCQKESEQNRERQQRIETLERYLADLPTLEDHQKQSRQLKESELKIAALQDTAAVLERELGDVRATCREQEAQIEAQKRRELELLSTVHRYMFQLLPSRRLHPTNWSRMTESFGTEWGGLAVLQGLTYLPPHKSFMEVPKSPKEDRLAGQGAAVHDKCREGDFSSGGGETTRRIGFSAERMRSTQEDYGQTAEEDGAVVCPSQGPREPGSPGRRNQPSSERGSDAARECTAAATHSRERAFGAEPGPDRKESDVAGTTSASRAGPAAPQGDRPSHP